MPAAWPDPGTYPPFQTVTLASEPGAAIYYTTDGSPPGASSTRYEGPILLDRSQTIRALAGDEAGNQSAVASFAYAVQPYKLEYSGSASRSNPLDLNGKTVNGKIYVFVLPESGAVRVDFHLDGAFRSTDTAAPWDFAGGSATAANPLNTKTLSRGLHTIKAVIYGSGGGLATITATFTAR